MASVGCIVAAAVASGCGGGGSSPTPRVTPTPNPSGSFSPLCSNGSATPPPTAPPSPSGGTFTPRPGSSVVLSEICVQSVPNGLAVSGSQSGTTPLTFSPTYSNSLGSVTVTPTSGSPYTFYFDQTASGVKNLLYNQSADTSGSIGTISTSSEARTSETIGRVRVAQSLHVGVHRHAGLPQFSTTRLAVTYRTGALQASGRSAESLERAEGVQHAVGIGFVHGGVSTRIVDVPAGTSLASFATRLKRHPEIADAQPLHLRYVSDVLRQPAGMLRRPAGAVRRPLSTTPVYPNDTHFGNYAQWDMFRIGAPNAWGYTEASGLQIAIIDTGADLTHEDLSGGKITFSESVIGGTITVGGNAAQDKDGHGTNVSGVAAADTNNNFGFAGVGFNANLQIYRIFPYTTNATADTGDEAQALYDAVAHGAKVINLSLGGQPASGFDPVERDAIEYAISQNVVVVAAAGNDSANTIEFPAAYPGVIAVGASALNDSSNPMVYSSATEYVASYSNTGPELSVVAPGGDPSGTSDNDALHWVVNLYTTTAPAGQQCSNLKDCYAFFAGTSQATPHVSGTAALLLALNSSLTPAQILTIVNSTADDIGDAKQGHGRLDAYRAAAAVKGDGSGLPAPTNLNFVAIAYVPNGTSTPQIINLTYPGGVQVGSNGTFRMVDIPPTSSYKIGVWYDANGDGKVDAGDWFGSSGTCSTSSSCSSASGITAAPVTSGFVLN